MITDVRTTMRTTNLNGAVRYELEFVDMDDTLEWLLENAELCGCDDAIKHLEAAKRIISKKRHSLFHK